MAIEILDAYLLVPSALHDAGLREYIRQSHLMVSLGLSKKKQTRLEHFRNIRDDAHA
jgi:hypothetical protein